MKKNIKNLALLSILGLMVSGCFGSVNNNSSTEKNPSSPKTSETSSSTKTPTSSSSSSTSSSSSSSTSSDKQSTSDSELKVKEIEVTGTYKTQYVIGETLDLTGVKLLVTYTDNSTNTVNVTESMITPVDMSTEGMKTVTVTYEGKTAAFYINVNAPAVEKVDPEVTISIENGATLTIGVDAAPTVTVPEGVNYTTYFEQDEVYVSDTLPTTPGTYSFIVETEENDQYNSARVWRWFRLVEPSTKEDAVVTFNYEPGETFVIGGAEQPTVTVSEGADYVITYSSEESGYDSTEFPTVAGTYSLVVTINENDLYKENKVWRWFRLEAPSEKAVAEITFNFENGATFTKGAEEKPEYTVSEGADVEIYYYSEERDLAGETATFYSYEELIPGYPYSLNVVVKENDLFKASSAWKWFRLEAPTEKVDPEVTVSIENGATLTIGVDAAPTVTVPEGVNYITYYELDGVKVSDTLPTTPGTYSFIVETEENDQYKALRTWRWFRLVAPSTKEAAEITFNYEAGTTYYIEGIERPTVTVSEGADYVITYESESGYNSEMFPTEPGTYSLVVTVNENDLFKADKQWLWFRLESSVNNGEATA